MEQCIRDNVFKNVFLLVVDYLNDKGDKKLNIVITNCDLIQTKIDSEMFFKAGQLLMILYIIDIKYLKRENIKYKNNVFYLNCISSSMINSTPYKRMVSSRDITDDIISKSVYNKRFLPMEVEYITEENLNDILDGFQDTYNILINEKFKLLKYLEKHTINVKYIEVIKYIKLLNPNDLKKQLQFISAKLRNYHNNLLINDLVKKNDNELLIDKNILDICIENAIIGYGKYGLELMWIEYKNCNVQSMESEIIYMAAVLAYVGYKDQNKYYIESSKQCLNSILSIWDTKVILDSELIEIIILLNRYLNYNKLNEFLSKKYGNSKILKDNIDIDFDHIMLKYFNEKKLDILSNIII